jgi:hypothetical protein
MHSALRVVALGAGDADARQDPQADILPVVQPVVPPAPVAHSRQGAAALIMARFPAFCGWLVSSGLI